MKRDMIHRSVLSFVAVLGICKIAGATDFWGYPEPSRDYTLEDAKNDPKGESVG